MNNSPTNEFLEQLATDRVYPLDNGGYVKVGDDLVALARELQQYRKAKDETDSKFALASQLIDLSMDMARATNMYGANYCGMKSLCGKCGGHLFGDALPCTCGRRYQK